MERKKEKWERYRARENTTKQRKKKGWERDTAKERETEDREKWYDKKKIQ